MSTPTGTSTPSHESPSHLRPRLPARTIGSLRGARRAGAEHDDDYWQGQHAKTVPEGVPPPPLHPSGTL